MIDLLAYTFSFIVMGLWLGIRVLKYRLYPKEFLYIVSLASSLLFCFILFFVYLKSPVWGHDLTKAFIVYSPLALLSIILSIKKSPQLFKTILHFFIPPLLITMGFFSVYSTLLYGCRYHVTTFDPRRPANNTFCSITEFPLDNGLPEMFGVDVLQQVPQPLVLDWSIANRPPLQIGATLPIEDLDRTAPQQTLSNYYNIFSIFLQLMWVGAVWAIFQRFKLKKRYQALLFIGFAVTGFFYVNSVFVWPKLLAGGLALAGMTPYIGAKLNKNLLRYLPVAAVLISLGLMAHGGVVFTVIPFIGLLLYKLYKPWRAKRLGYKPIVIALLLTIAIFVPWEAYSATIPDAAYLTKYQFANVTDANAAAKHGTLTTIVDAYKNLTFTQWLRDKGQNLETLVVGNGSEGFMYICPLNHVVASRNQCAKQRDLTFFSTLFSLESFAVGILFLMYQAFRRRLDSFDKESVLLIGASLIIWVLLLFAPGSTVVHQGSYFNDILLFILVGRSILRASPRFLAFLVFAQIIIFYLSWIRPFPYFTFS